MGEQVRGLEVVLASGETVSWSDAAKAAGPALWQAFVGSEGTLGVMTRIDVQLFPRPAARAFLAYRFPAFPEGFAAIREILGLGLRPAMIDFEETEEPGLPLGVPADLYLAFDGPPEVVAAAANLAAGRARPYDGADRGEAAARDFWERRHEVAEWFVRRPPGSWRRPGPAHPEVYVNLAVPTGRLLDYCSRVITLAREAGVEVGSFGIWGRPELLSFTLGAGPDALDALPAAVDRALRLARDEGGSIEYCHGVGVRLAHLSAEEFGPTAPVLQAIKAALDPKGVLNPGKLGIKT
jgi:alkyldihydroxyacetonephosphate synthase